MSALLRAALPLAAIVQAASDVSFKPDSEPPADLSRNDFRLAAAQPNATNAVTLTFGNGTSDDDLGTANWGMRIGVTAGVPLEDDEVTTLTLVSLIVPEGLSGGDDDDDNKLCLSVLGGLSNKATRDLQDDRGTCEELSSSCREALEKAAADRDDCGEDFDIPDECDDWFSSDLSWSDEIASNSSANGRVWARTTTPQDEGSDDAEEAYNRAVTQVWPVLVSRDASGSGREAALRCLRAASIATGSDEPDSVPDRDAQADGDEGDDDNDSSNGSGGNSDSNNDGDGDGDDDNAAGVTRAGALGVVGAVVAALMMTL